MLVVAESREIPLSHLVLTLWVHLCLWMEVCPERMIRTQVRPYLGPEPAWNLHATIWYYVVWDPVLSSDMVKEEPGQFRRVDILPAQYVDCDPGWLVHDQVNAGVARCHWLWQVTDEDNRDDLPWPWWCLHVHVYPVPGVPRCFHLVAHCAATDILANIWVHCWPAEISRYQLSSLRISKMTNLRVVMQ